MKINIPKLIINLAIPLAVGALSGFLTSSSMEHFNSLNQPPLSPPDIVFPIVWTALFLMMGVASYLVMNSDADSDEKKSAITAYYINLFFNFFWSIIFFNLEMYLFAFVWLIILLAIIITMAVMFYRISKPAGLLMVPYIFWVTFAGYLNIAIYFLNR